MPAKALQTPVTEDGRDNFNYAWQRTPCSAMRAAAAVCVTRPGAMDSIPSSREVMALVRLK